MMDLSDLRYFNSGGFTQGVTSSHAQSKPPEFKVNLYLTTQETTGIQH